jgi:hypothetical protein
MMGENKVRRISLFELLEGLLNFLSAIREKTLLE